MTPYLALLIRGGVPPSASMSLPDAISEKRGQDLEITTPVESSEGSSGTLSPAGSESSQVVLCREPSGDQQLVGGIMEENPDGGDGKEYFCGFGFCGFGKCRPKWLQVFRNANFFTFLMCLNATIEGAIVSGKVLYYAVYQVKYYIMQCIR